MTTLGRLISASLLAGATAISCAQAFDVGGSVGIFYPSSSQMRDLFGNSSLRVGFSPAGHVPGNSWHLVPDVSALSASKDGNRFFVAPLTLDLERSFGEPKATTHPYIRVGAGVAYYDYGITVGATRFSSKSFGSAFLAEVGVAFGDKIRLSANYTGLQKKDNLDFSGLTLNLTYTLFRL